MRNHIKRKEGKNTLRDYTLYRKEVEEIIILKISAIIDMPISIGEYNDREHAEMTSIRVKKDNRHSQLHDVVESQNTLRKVAFVFSCDLTNHVCLEDRTHFQ
jgi:hypothetical protein